MINNKQDMITFAEDVLGYELLPWQKEIIKRYQNGEQVYLTGFRSGKRMLCNIIKQYEKLISKEM